MPLESIKTQNIGDMVFQQLSAAISSGEWPPGTKIPSENKLAQMLDVSRVSVRSALQRLGSLGLIESRRGDGTFVCDLSGSHYLNSMIPYIALSDTNTRSMFEFRRIIEVESAALAAERADKDLVARMETANARMAEYNSSSAAADMDLEFHYLIAKATGNPIIIKVYEILWDYYLSLFRTNVAVLGSYGVRHHSRLIEAIRAGNPAEARAVMGEHLEATLNEIENITKNLKGAEK